MSRKLFDKYLKPIKYNDAFGHNEVWNDEIEKWLSSVPVEHIEKNKGRFGKAGREKQRDNFFGRTLCQLLLTRQIRLESKRDISYRKW